MAVVKYNLVGPNPPVTYYLCDTDAEKPVSAIQPGDLAYAKDTESAYTARTGTAWGKSTKTHLAIAPLLISAVGEILTPTLGGTEIPNTRATVNLTGLVLASFRASLTLSPAVSLRVEYSLTGGSTWDSLIAATPVTSLDVTLQSSWQTIPAAAMTSVLLRGVAVGVIQIRVHFLDVQMA